jgi:hypothetical protein
MSKRSAGVIFCCVAVALFLSRYALALWYRGPYRGTWGEEDFSWHLRYIGMGPWIAAAAFLLVGVVYLIRAEQDH